MSEIQAIDYTIYVGTEALIKLEDLLVKQYKSSAIFVLVDENSHQHCWPNLITQCPSLEDAELIEIPSGENHKDINTVVQLWGALTSFKVKRNDLLINLGGGVITDMGGFVAATYKRGIDFIQIPTTLLSMVDASVGGKLGIDFEGYKNQVGLYGSPKAVFVVPSFLNSLDKRELLSGYAEVIKHGLILNKAYWELILSHPFDEIEEKGLNELIEGSIAIKNDVVANDPKEENQRKLLNFGHTIGHAVETFFLNNNRDVRHGEAVALGIVIECYLSHLVCEISMELVEEISSFVLAHYNHIAIDEKDLDAIISLMYQDKKNTNDSINFSLMDDLGNGKVNCVANEEEIKKGFQYYSNLKK